MTSKLTWPIILLFGTFICGVALLKLTHDKINNDRPEPNKKNPLYIPVSQGYKDNKIVYNINNKKMVNDILNDSVNEYHDISKTLCKTVFNMIPYPNSIDIQNENGKYKLYYRGIPHICKINEPQVWNSALKNIAIPSIFKNDNGTQIRFNQDPLEEFIFGVCQSMNITHKNHDIICILMVKMVILTQPGKKYQFYDLKTFASYIIPIYFEDLSEVMDDQYIKDLLIKKLKINSVNSLN